MTEERKKRRGTAGETAGFTGAQAEITVNTSENRAVVHDGETVGGFPLALEIETVGTSVISGGQVTINAGDNTKIDVAACIGDILDNTNPAIPIHTKINFAGATAVTIANQGVILTYWFIDNAGLLQQTIIKPTRENRRVRLYLGNSAFQTGIVIATNSEADPAQQHINQLSDLASFLGQIKNGLIPTNANADLTWKLGAGEVFNFGSGFHTAPLDPHVLAFDESDPVTFAHNVQDGTLFADVTILDVANYDVASVVTPIPGASTRATIFTIWAFTLPVLLIRVQYGDTFYDSQTDAQEALATGAHQTIVPPLFEEGIILGFITVTKGEINLQNAIFTSTNKFGAIGGGVAGLSGSFLQIENNLSDLADIPTAVANLGLGANDSVAHSILTLEKSLIVMEQATPEASVAGFGQFAVDDNGNPIFIDDTGVIYQLNRIVQVVNTQTGAVATGTIVIPADDTIPQITEGDEYMTLAITPKNTSNFLKIEVVLASAHTGGGAWTVALFQDSTANALAAMYNFYEGNNLQGQIKFTHYMTAGTTSATTFRVRAGDVGAGTTTFNGISGGRIFGGVMASSITITEIAV